MTEPAATIPVPAETGHVPEVVITPRDDGPYRVAGPIVLRDMDGNRWELPPGKPVFLCRCGQSASKPFCDGTHRRVGFESRVRAPEPPETLREG